MEINSHKVGMFNEKIEVTPVGERGSGGEYKEYKVHANSFSSHLWFQNGASESNGLTNEVLLAIVIHRLTCFQEGSFSCRENALAITKAQEALHWLHHRTRDRIERGVEGVMEP